jgi:ABC-type nitrate/sulfonate/bicarbonate transport system substrate-binding protein
MEPLVWRAAAAGCRSIADLRWRGGIVAGADVDEETAAKLRRALNRAVAWLRENEERSRDELLRDLAPEQRKDGLLPELRGVTSYEPAEFKEKVDWMVERGLLSEAPAYHDIVRSK